MGGKRHGCEYETRFEETVGDGGDDNIGCVIGNNLEFFVEKETVAVD
ncbi:hypothetical protein A2U01_0047999 [Trifolium medium]|uniref:Uncharacterized protein n=1 Tax=Trifolium medium TaxID=97028 RepID=A0A392QSF5_9FABA|nr:hypothetical protein [Trifolium medium]